MSFIDDINKTRVVSHTYLTIEIQNMGNKKFKSVLFLEIMTFEKIKRRFSSRFKHQVSLRYFASAKIIMGLFVSVEIHMPKKSSL